MLPSDQAIGEPHGASWGIWMDQPLDFGVPSHTRQLVHELIIYISYTPCFINYHTLFTHECKRTTVILSLYRRNSFSVEAVEGTNIMLRIPAIFSTPVYHTGFLSTEKAEARPKTVVQRKHISFQWLPVPCLHSFQPLSSGNQLPIPNPYPSTTTTCWTHQPLAWLRMVIRTPPAWDKDLTISRLCKDTFTINFHHQTAVVGSNIMAMIVACDQSVVSHLWQTIWCS